MAQSIKPMRRRHQRISIRRAVHIVPPDRNAALPGHTVNMSESGAFLEATEMLPVGTEFAFRLPLNTGQPVRLKGRVVRIEPGLGMGVEFVELPEIAQRFLQEIVHSPALPAPATRHPVTIWYEGQKAPVRSQASFTADGLCVSTKLPFLRQDSTVTFRLEGDEHVHVGVLDSVGFSVSNEDHIPRLSIRLGLPSELGSRAGMLQRRAADLRNNGDEKEIALQEDVEIDFASQGKNIEEAVQNFVRYAKSYRPSPTPAPKPTGDDGHSLRKAIDSMRNGELEALTDFVSELDRKTKQTQPNKTDKRKKVSAPSPAVDDVKTSKEIPPSESEDNQQLVTSQTSPMEQALESWEAIQAESVTEEYFEEGEPIEDSAGLQHIDLSGTMLTDKGLAHLSEIRNLSYLSLRGTQVSDEGIAKLSDLQSIKHLDLSHTNITDAGLEHLRHVNENNSLLPGQTNDDEERDPTDHDPKIRRGLLLPVLAALVTGAALILIIIWGVSSFRSTSAEGGQIVGDALSSAASTQPGNAPERTKRALETPETTKNPSPPPSLTSKRESPAMPETADQEVNRDGNSSEATNSGSTLRIISEGSADVLVIPVSGRADEMDYYPLNGIHGIAIDLPRARPLVPFGHYFPNESGFHRVMINRGVHRTDDGMHVRVHFAAREEDHRVTVVDGVLRVTLPR